MPRLAPPVGVRGIKPPQMKLGEKVMAKKGMNRLRSNENTSASPAWQEEELSGEQERTRRLLEQSLFTLSRNHERASEKSEKKFTQEEVARRIQEDSYVIPLHGLLLTLENPRSPVRLLAELPVNLHLADALARVVLLDVSGLDNWKEQLSFTVCSEAANEARTHRFVLAYHDKTPLQLGFETVYFQDMNMEEAYEDTTRPLRFLSFND